ncbi:MAG: DNA repair protein RecO [Bacteroidetes bacterium]|nr:MAG: DNA repair protein RecO [Bacteroidota bacterium]
MIFSTQGILLHRLKFSDSKLILKILTKEFGLQSYLYFISTTTKNKYKLNLLQPMYILELQVYNKEMPGLQKIKEVSAAEIFKTIPFDIYKQTLSFFLAEFISKILEENQTDKELFDYIFNSVKLLDSENCDVNDFHINFLYKLTEFLGIMPENNYSSSKKIFDLQAAKFIIGYPNHRNFFNESMSRKFNELIKLQSFDRSVFKLSNPERRELLQGIINFYNIHLNRPGKLKSLTVLAQVFS